MANVLKIHPADTVVVALAPVPAGTSLADFGLTVTADVPPGHKIALRPHAVGDRVLKYGGVIGQATAAIGPGDHVHAHNLKTTLGIDTAYRYAGPPPEAPSVPAEDRTIPAFVRANGEIGIRNDLWIIPLVGCVNGLARTAARRIEASGLLPDGTRAMVLEHPYGCSQLGDDLDNTRNILRALAVHPNAGGVLVIGLGCENNTPALFQAGFAHPDPRRLRYLIAQDETDEMAAALEHLGALAAVLHADTRAPVGVDRLRVGLKCGGSDGFSGITANPLLGAFSDWLCVRGGSTVLTEVPEMFGAEHLLMERAENTDVFDAVVHLIQDFKAYFTVHDQPIYENPSPGNKAGGISTLEEKSLGCTQKAGRAPVRDVIRYAQRIRRPGLTLLEAPGNDGVAVTALAAAGCHLELFTTGRGTPLGGIVPTLKIATNTALYQKKPHWMDFNAGPIAEDGVAVADLLPDFIDTVLSVAAGAQTRNERNGVHDVVLFKTGVTL
ncbi:UxaA family hydrolase [Roseospira visakhapatnamensis]|uniref:Altronate hydrolase n=1 Tax=Roseospira visakhapatnamensis TaxID=390880 RepID=A0A7W6RCZ6_9PROT|nr:altronate dehydratase family protein [Roseospira visakhapatnamensis]MBB4265786.1 altronate hydrolase [Roseospira visakhapatnamensis]